MCAAEKLDISKNAEFLVAGLFGQKAKDLELAKAKEAAEASDS